MRSGCSRVVPCTGFGDRWLLMLCHSLSEREEKTGLYQYLDEPAAKPELALASKCDEAG